MADRLISCDDHMDLAQLPADLWTTRLPAALRDRAPHIEERDGQAVWICDGKVWGRWDGKPPATGNQRPVKPLYNAFDRAGIHDQSERRPANAELRLADMDRDGVQAQVIFGPIFQISTDDPALRDACYRVYNDWLMEFCQAAPDRLIGVPMLPETPGRRTDRTAAPRREGRRAAGHADDRQHQPEARRPGLGAAVAGAGGHRASSCPGTSRCSSASRAAAPPARPASVFENTKFFMANFLEPFVDLFAWGILERHPKLKMVMAEAGTGWLPWLVQELDYRHWRLWEAKDFWADKGGIRARNQAVASCSSGRSTRPSRKITWRCR